MITILAAGCGSGNGAASASAPAAALSPEEPDVTVAAIPAVGVGRNETWAPAGTEIWET
jgi:hypothetical protein